MPTFWCWTSWQSLLSPAQRLWEVRVWCCPLKPAGSTQTHTWVQSKKTGRGEKEITMRFSASQSSPPHQVVWKPWPRWPQRPPSAGLRLSDSNWLGMAGGNKQSRTGPTWQRQCMESNGSFNNYSPYPATTKPIQSRTALICTEAQLEQQGTTKV